MKEVHNKKFLIKKKKQVCSSLVCFSFLIINVDDESIPNNDQNIDNVPADDTEIGNQLDNNEYQDNQGFHSKHLTLSLLLAY